MEQRNYYFGQDYSLTFKRLSQLEEEFIRIISDYALRYPLMWQALQENVFGEPSITYVRDTTFIISTYLLDKNDAYWLFNLLKLLLRNGQVTKIIYKKEFIIVHLDNEFIVEVLTVRKKWLAIVNYQLLKENYIDNVYLNTIYEDHNHQEIIDVLYLDHNQNKKICFNVVNCNNNINNSDLDFYYIYIYQERQMSKYPSLKKLQFDYQIPLYKKELSNILQN